ncbi:MAG: MarR family winged helix-turn-helix transcriptional regulator [Clostridia bacterium]|nr:MarR family winged helix-turn-helix transcriptional regulator [Clostridia bacterium]
MDINFHNELGRKMDELSCYMNRNLIFPIQVMSQKSLKIFELNNSERFILATIKIVQENSIKSLATATGLSYDGVSKTVCVLEDKGYVERFFAKGDRRNTMARLTEEGMRLYEEADLVTARISMEALNKRMSDEDQMKMMESLTSLIESLKSFDLREDVK